MGGSEAVADHTWLAWYLYHISLLAGGAGGAGGAGPARAAPGNRPDTITALSWCWADRHESEWAVMDTMTIQGSHHTTCPPSPPPAGQHHSCQQVHRDCDCAHYHTTTTTRSQHGILNPFFRFIHRFSGEYNNHSKYIVNITTKPWALPHLSTSCSV